MRRLARGSAIAVAVAASLVVGMTGPAQADEGQQELASTLDALEAATASVDAVTGTDVVDVARDTTAGGDTAAVARTAAGIVDMPVTTDGEVSIGTGADAVEIGLPDAGVPASASVDAASDTVVYSDPEQPADLAVQATEQGARALITIKDATAPRSYTFPIDGPEGSRLVSAAEYAMGAEGGSEEVSLDTGEVYLVAADGVSVLASFDAPWATDANGVAVPTHYELDGRDLTQVIDFTEDSAFPIVADPSFWKILACTAAVLAFIGGNMIFVAKIIRIKKYINALGGARRAVELMLKGSNWEERFKYGGQALVNLAGELAGVGSVHAACF
jgi:hypothetical protein